MTSPGTATPLRRAQSAEDFCAAPVGAYVTGCVFLFFYPHEELSGYAAWGTPSGEEAADASRIDG
jgi:hypothetical protein